MKKIILIPVLLFSISVFSQTTIKPGIGVNVSDFSKSPNGSAKGKVGYQLGGSIAFGKKIYFEPGLFYVGKSTQFSTYSAGSGSATVQYDTKIQGVRIPVNVGINFLGSEKSTLSVRVFGGLSAFFITSTDEISKDSVNKTSWGTQLGAGLDFWKVFLDLSYEWSLTNVQKDISQIDLGKSRTFFITGGLRINF